MQKIVMYVMAIFVTIGLLGQLASLTAVEASDARTNAEEITKKRKKTRTKKQ